MKKLFPKLSLLDGAILAGLTAVFLSVALPLIRGAVIRHRTAECARKFLWAADAVDFYVATTGEYPPGCDGGRPESSPMQGALAMLEIDWWGRETELGGHWGWCRGTQTGAVYISGMRLSDRQMSRLDTILDDGDLNTGQFQRRGTYCFYSIVEETL